MRSLNDVALLTKAQRTMERLKGTGALAVFANENMYIIHSDLPEADFRSIEEFLRWRLHILGLDVFLKEVDEASAKDLVLDIFDEGLDRWCKATLEDLYGAERL